VPVQRQNWAQLVALCITHQKEKPCTNKGFPCLCRVSCNLAGMRGSLSRFSFTGNDNSNLHNLQMAGADWGAGLTGNEVLYRPLCTENRKRKMMRSKVSVKALVRKTKELARINNRIGQMYSGQKKCVKMMTSFSRGPRPPKHRGSRVKVPGRHGTGGVAGPRHPGPRRGGVAGPRHPGPRKGMPRPRKGQNPPKN
jgi:hypothetical protein